MEDNDSVKSFEAFAAWMDALNQEAVERGFWDCPLCKEIAHSRNCWMVDFHDGLTPAQALDAQAD